MEILSITRCTITGLWCLTVRLAGEIDTITIYATDGAATRIAQIA
jgi:hypothetical protein